jgi:hypothetical protein
MFLERRKGDGLQQAGRRFGGQVMKPDLTEIKNAAYDKAKVCEVLYAVGWLLKNEEKGRWQHQRRVGKARSYYFVLKNEAPPETEE